MAAARRNAGSGVLVAMIVFLVLFLITAAAALYLGTRWKENQQAVQSLQASFQEQVGQVFRDNNWTLTTQAANDLGVELSEQTFRDVAQKLQQAGTYEQTVQPLLGWESVDGMQQALQESAIQDGQDLYNTLQGLVQAYESTYAELRGQVRQLQGERASLQEQLAEVSRRHQQTVQNIEQQLTEANRQFEQSLEQMREQYQQIVQRFDNMQEQALEWQEKHEQEVTDRRQQVANLREQVADLRQQLRAALEPAEGEEMQPAGEIVRVEGRRNQVYVGPEPDTEIRENQTLVVYNITPTGQKRRKGLVRVRRLMESTALATIITEDEPIIEGDFFVNQQQWEFFQGGEQS